MGDFLLCRFTACPSMLNDDTKMVHRSTEIRKDAQNLKEIVGTRMRRVEFHSENQSDNDTRAALKSMLQNMKEE